MSAMPPASIGGCRLCHECGTGAYGTVYWGHDAIGRAVAVKLFHGTRDYTAELASLRRYSALQERSPYLMRIYHFGCEDGRLYYIMEAADNAAGDIGGTSSPDGVEGYSADTLARRLKTGQRMATADAIALCRKLMDGLEVLHSAGMAHRDLKPDNIIFVGGEPRISDPDLICESSRTMSLVGTLGYIPPEILLHPNLNKGSGADIYALGKMLYCTATGESPESFPKWPPTLSQESLSRLCLPLLRLCSEEPSLRPRSIAECRELLEPESDAAVSARRRRRLVTWCSAALAILLAVILAACLWWHCRTTRLSAVMASERAWWQQLQPALSAQLSQPMAGLSEEERQALLGELDGLLATDESSCGYSEWRRRVLKLRTGLRAAALSCVPSTDASGYTLETVLSNGCGFGYLETPLATAFLPEASREELARQLAEESARIYPEYADLRAGENLFFAHTDVPFGMTFVPPAQLLAPEVSSEPLSVDYPFWILPEPVTAGLYSHLVPPLPSENRLRSGSEMMVQVCMNDIMLFCSRLTKRLAAASAIPPGYGIRLPTVQELAVASRKLGGDLLDSQGAIPSDRFEFLGECPPASVRYGDYPGAFPREYPGSALFQEGWQVTHCAVPMEQYLWGAGDGVFIRSHRDFRNMLMVGFRVVLAPMEEGYYQRHCTFRHDANYATAPSGRRYMGFATSMACIPCLALEEYAESLGGHLAEPQTPEEWSALRRALDIPSTFPVYLNARLEASTQRWRYVVCGKSPEFLSIPAIQNEAASRIYAGVDKVGLSDGTSGVPGIVIEWPDEASAKAAGDRWRDGTAKVVRRKLSVGGRDYLLVAVTAPAYYAEALCNAAGFSLAVPTDSATLAMLQEALQEEQEPILLGGHRTFDGGGWEWNDGRPVEVTPTAPNATIERLSCCSLRASPTYDSLCLSRGKLAAVSHGSLMLVEDR